MKPATRAWWPAKTALLIAVAVFAAGCRQDMHNQPKYRPLRSSTFFADGSSARPLIEGTVARGTLRDDEVFFTGKSAKVPVAEMPFPVDQQVLDRGQERFDIFCSPCHDRIGTGRGMVVQRGYPAPPSLHLDRLRDAPIGHFFDIMTNGLNTMPDYREQISPRDRWAIAAYIRALQLSQRAAEADVPESERQKLSAPPPGGAPAQRHQ